MFVRSNLWFLQNGHDRIGDLDQVRAGELVVTSVDDGGGLGLEIEAEEAQRETLRS